MKKLSRKWRVTVGVLLLLLGLCALATALTLPAIIHEYLLPHLDEMGRDSRAAVVLGAKTHNNVMSSVLKSRVDTAIDLYRSHQVGTIIFTGGFRDKDPARELSESALARAYALQRGIPAQAILIDEVSVDTWSNLQQARNLMQAHGLTTAVLVSDRWHLARAERMAQDLEMQVVAVPVVHSVFVSRRAQWGFIAREVVKMGWYRLGKLFKS